MKRLNQDRSEGALYNDLDEQIMADVRGHLRNAGDWKKLSQDSGVSYATIENFAYGWTQRPHQHTITRLMEAMGLGEELRRAYQSDAPVSKADALATRSPALKKRHASIKKGAKKRKRKLQKAMKLLRTQDAAGGEK